MNAINGYSRAKIVNGKAKATPNPNMPMVS